MCRITGLFQWPVLGLTSCNSLLRAVDTATPSTSCFNGLFSALPHVTRDEFGDYDEEHDDCFNGLFSALPHVTDWDDEHDDYDESCFNGLFSALPHVT